MKWWMLGLMLLIASFAEAQYYYYNNKYYDQQILIESGIQAGYMNCLSDLGGNKGPGKGFIKDLNHKAAKANAGVFLGILFQKKFGLRLNIIKGKTGGADSLITDNSLEARQRYNRNLHFQSPINEITLFTEIHLLQIFSSEKNKTLVSPYVGIGLGLFSFRPKARLHNSWHELSKFSTEGQGISRKPYTQPYKLLQFNIPAGIGLLIETGAKWNVRCEIQHRKLFTDYLDDVSTRYVDPEIFSNYFDAEKAAIAEQLHDRRRIKSYRAAGSIRGGKGNDSYFSANIMVSYIFNRKAIF